MVAVCVATLVSSRTRWTVGLYAYLRERIDQMAHRDQFAIEDGSSSPAEAHGTLSDQIQGENDRIKCVAQFATERRQLPVQ